MTVFYGLFKSNEDVLSAFKIDASELDGCDILFAGYIIGGDYGEAQVLFKKDGDLFLVDAWHHKSKDLAGRWYPFKTSARVLLAWPRGVSAFPEICKEICKSMTCEERFAKKELLEALCVLKGEGDTEKAHIVADTLLLEYIGDNDIIRAFDDIGKWHA
jgi:hypothetical protein